MAVIDLVRHAQGYHNVSVENLGMLDPQLTPLGEQQCADLRARYPYHDRVRMLIASPLRRTLRTCMLGFGPVDGKTPSGSATAPTCVVAVPELQELSALPSDTGSPPAVLHREFTEAEVDLSRVLDGWTDKGHGSPFAAEIGPIEVRARKARHILRALAASLGPDDRIIVVSHGGFLHFLTEDYDGVTTTRGWDNAEWRSFVFVDPTGTDDAALLSETDESRIARSGTTKGLTEQEQMELQLVFREFLAMENRHADSTGGLVRCRAAVAAEAKEKAAGGKAQV